MSLEVVLLDKKRIIYLGDTGFVQSAAKTLVVEGTG